jgi:hypothetical protein
MKNWGYFNPFKVKIKVFKEENHKDNMEGENVDTIIDGLKFIVASKGMKVSDDILFQEACSIYRVQVASKKYSGGASSSPFKKNSFSSPPDSKPTKKQLGYLHGNNIKFDEDKITKQKAIKLISKHKEEGVNTI